LQLKITGQAYGGFGIARHEGRVFFVADTIKGDEVSVVITEEKKNFSFASVSKFINYSSLRTYPSDCPYDESCGGCQWVSIPHETQLEFKKEFLIDALTRTGKLSLIPPIKVHSSTPRYYRNRALLRGTIHEDGRIQVGFMERASHRQVGVEHCLNLNTPINDLIAFLSKTQTQSKAQKFRIEIQVLPSFKDKLLLVLHSLHGIESLRSLYKELKQHPSVHWIGFAQDLSKAPLFLFETDLDCDFYTSPGAFQQVNLTLNQEVRKLIKNFVEAHSIHSILDLFCGSGNLSIALAKSSRRVHGIEDSPNAIRIAQKNIEANALTNTTYVCAPAHRGLKSIDFKAFDLIITDPPRKGMKECLDSILASKIPYLIYMSCDPVTLARDLKTLTEVYEIIELHLFDFFSNTYHLESLVFLKRRYDFIPRRANLEVRKVDWDM
jgi:23S rRNA (uracil1939-C5)-methyltransferase